MIRLLLERHPFLTGVAVGMFGSRALRRKLNTFLDKNVTFISVKMEKPDTEKESNEIKED